MFSIFKKKIKEDIDFSGLQCDMHSHLLPGIDDGSPDIETSIHLIKGLNDLGYSRLITTPHIYWDVYKNKPETIIPAKEIVIETLRQQKVQLTLHAAAEYFLDDHVERLLKEKQPLLPLQDSLLLVEFSFVTAPMNWKSYIFELQMNGYQPVLAHPERYTYFADKKKIFDEIKTAGCLLQINLLSLTGYYGKMEKDIANYLVQNNLVSFLGTDMHNIRHLDVLRGSAPVIMPVVKKLLDSGALINPALLT